MSEYKEIRTKKQNNWNQIQEKYPDKFDVNCDVIQAKELADGTCNIKLAGRLMFLREMGKLAFGKIRSYKGSFQIVLKQDAIASEQMKFYLDNLDIGDIIGVEGTIFTTKTGEKSLEVSNLVLLSKCLLPLPEKWHGLVDDDQKQRQRYLDLLVNEESTEKFKFRYAFIAELKNFLQKHEFIEVETPILQTKASGALATPFQTHHKALDIPLFLRIAPETYLKRLMVGGYERVFELGKSFRNEGIDTSHLQEFTMLEFYAAYWNYLDAILFVEKIFENIFEKLHIPKKFSYENQEIDFSFPWQRISYRDLVLKYTGLDLEILLRDEKALKFAARDFVDVDSYKSLGSLVDGLYKKHCRPHLINPHVVMQQPAILGPLARVSSKNTLWSDRFQVVVNGWEVVNSYSELVDPVYQRQTLEEQKCLAQNGEEEAMEMEDDFLLAMEYGMPPMAGVGIGIDRVVALFTNSSSLRDVIFFPNLK